MGRAKGQISPLTISRAEMYLSNPDVTGGLWGYIDSDGYQVVAKDCKYACESICSIDIRIWKHYIFDKAAGIDSLFENIIFGGNQ